MASTKVKAIVLKGNNNKDKDKLLHLYTLEQGKMIVSMRGVRGEKAKLKSAKEIFCFGEFVIEQSKNTNIVTAVDIIDNFYDLSKDIEKYYEGCAILDIVDNMFQEINPPLFVNIIKAIKTLCYDKVKKYYVLDKFLIEIFSAMGYSFLTENCSSCKAKLSSRYFNLEIGEIVCPSCKTMTCIPISDACYSSLRLLNNTPYERLVTLKLGGNGEVQAFDLLSKNYQWRTGYKVIDIV